MAADPTSLRSFNVRQQLTRLGALVRWWEWSDSKLPLYLVAMSYVVLRMEHLGAAQAVQMAVLLVLLSLFAAFGHIINDYADREADRMAGKHRILARWSESAALIALTIPGVGTVAVAAAFFDRSTAALTVLAVLLAVLYSLPPVRLKERGILGWAAATLAQRTLPVALVFQALHFWDEVALGLIVLNTLIGLRFIIVHQLRDRVSDWRSGVRTMATEFSPHRLVALLRGLFFLEVACACAVIAAMSYFEPPVALLVPVYAAYLVILRARGRPSPVSYFIFHGFYCGLWPVALAVLLAVRNPVFLSVVFVAMLLVQRQMRQRFRSVFIGSGETPRPAESLRPRGRRGTPPANLEINRADPYPQYAQLRAMAPVIRLDWPGLGQTWVVTRHREAMTVFKDPRYVRSVPTTRQHASGPARGFGTDMLELDPPDHTRLRKLVSQAFTPRMIQQSAPRIEQLATQILDQARSRGEIELISEYAAVIPIKIIHEILGVPLGEIESVRSFLYSLTFSQMTGQRSSALEAQKLRFTNDLEAVFEARRAEPRDDLVTALVRAEQDGDHLSSDELIGMVYLLLLAGFMTTVNLIGNGAHALLRHPDQLDMLRRNVDLADTAVEELLRFDGPLELTSVCFASTGIELGGLAIPMGGPIRVLLPSVNRDPEEFFAPDTLDITRDPCPHLTFAQGIHHCLGAPLARLEGKIAFNVLLAGAPNLRIIDPSRIQWLSHPMFRGMRQLPLRF